MLSSHNIIEALNVWNFWNGRVEHFVYRNVYLKKIDLFKSSKEIIVLKGIRRSGKSSLLYLEIESLIKSGVSTENILFVNFEEPKFSNYLDVSLLDAVYESYLEFLNPKGQIYIFLDEVQVVDGWEKWVLKMYGTHKNVQLYVTGSSSKLLSSEFSTALSGRHLSVDVYPLSFREFLVFKEIIVTKKLDIISKNLEIKKAFSEYLKWGGFPKISTLEKELVKKSELISYYDTIILKDIAQRHSLSYSSDLKKLSLYLLSNVSKLYSINKLKNLNLGAYDTIKKYIEFLKETYVIFDVELYDVSLKKQLINPKKIYCIDTGLLQAVSFRFSEDYGRLLENCVYIELKRRGLEVYYHRQKKECDFVIKGGNSIVSAIQVSASLEDEDTRKREIEGLLDACRTYNLKEGLILTKEEEEEYFIEGVKISIVPVYKWLLK